MVTFGSVKEKEFILLEQGEYVLTLDGLEETAGQWGDRMIWKFLPAPKDAPDEYIRKQNGDVYELWAFTDCDIILGSMAHEFAQTLTGRKLGTDDEPPDEDDLLGHRLVAYVTHETPTRGKNAGKKRESIVAGSIKPFKGAQPNTVKHTVAAPAKPAPAAVDRDAALKRVEKLIGKAVMLETPNHLMFVGADLSAGDADYLTELATEIEAEIKAAVEA